MISERYLAFEKAVATALAPDGFARGGRSHEHGVDLIHRERAIVIELKLFGGAVRELSAGIMRLARICSDLDAQRAVLAIWSPGLSTGRARDEWTRNLAVLAPKISRRLQLVMVSPSGDFRVPDDEIGGRIADAVRAAAEVLGKETRRPDRSHEVLKVLLKRWLLGEEPIAIGGLQAQTGLSHPTVSAGLRELSDVVQRTSNRSVMLREFPIRAWERLVALAPRARQSRWFRDSSGRPTNLGSMIQRIRRQKWTHIAFGGVVAAREWQPDFDLSGTPRVDVEVHAPLGSADLGFIELLDPALTPASIEEAGVVLAVHVVTRPEPYSFFTPSSSDGTWKSDPVEVLLDLTELRLVAQADELVRHLRRSRP